LTAQENKPRTIEDLIREAVRLAHQRAAGFATEAALLDLLLVAAAHGQAYSYARIRGRHTR
jgi:hypothetical protein